MGGGAEVFDVEFVEVAEGVDANEEVVEVDLGIVLTAAGISAGLFENKEGAFSLIELFFAGLDEEGVGKGRPHVGDPGGFNGRATVGWMAVGKGLLDPEDGLSVI